VNEFAVMPCGETPPLVLVCIEREANMHRALATSRTFAVSVLSSEQEKVARHFADRRRPLGIEQFDVVDWLPGPSTDAPLIAGALAYYECDLWRTYDGGDHTIFMGRVLAHSRQADQDALLFHDGRFCRLQGKPLGVVR
jgi:flavin reductase (DIM6/NTAB) family NADH-FMN oxidoreductase RutF